MTFPAVPTETDETAAKVARATGQGFHSPAVVKGYGDDWHPYCPGCSHVAETWVNPCEMQRDEWPNGPLVTFPEPPYEAVADSVTAVEGMTEEATANRLRGIEELLADQHFDQVGVLHNADARFLFAEFRRSLDRERQLAGRIERLEASVKAHGGGI